MVTSGPSKGAIVKLTGGQLSVGRESSNDLCLQDHLVSRKHCSISETDAGFQLVDLDSHNGSFVNGTPVRRKLLEHGDTIRAGECELVFLITEDEELVAHMVQFRDDAALDALATITTHQLRIPSSVDASSDVGRMARDLNALFKIANAINSIHELGALQRELLQMICEVAPADSGAIVITPTVEDEPTSSCTWSRGTDQAAPLRIRRELMQRALWERAAVLSHPTAGSAEADHVLCVPLIAVERTVGVLYLVSTSAAGFEEDHVNFVNSVAGIAAVTLENVLALEALRDENRRLQAELDLGGVILGESKGMRQVQDFIGRVAHGDSTVLIRGESGTGKELVAHAIHRNSPRAPQPFVAINCAAIPETLLESELFGHEKGAFTGAIATKKGKLEVAEAGTIFLDEIGDLPPAMQAKMLRVLQENEFQRVGGTRTLNLAARVVAATNKNLEEAIKNGTFRQDLYYRLNVVSVVVPPLRERPDDIPLLAIYFAAKYAQKCKRSLKGISTEARSRLMSYSWPGNVRELENAIEHAIVLGVTDEILPEDLPVALLEVPTQERSNGDYHEQINQLKKQLIIDAVAKTQGNYTEAAKSLGLHPNYLHRLIKNLDIKAELKGE
ncbi:MAG: sigma 54-interacting transcriptional regulator [Acidobacteriota bacterium]|nr:sigma 54-interacting transcriptional regulator [Acidobacteriota bacterium]